MSFLSDDNFLQSLDPVIHSVLLIDVDAAPDNLIEAEAGIEGKYYDLSFCIIFQNFRVFSNTDK